MELLSTREWATVIWGFVFWVYAMAHKQIRESKHRRLILIACKLSVHKVMLFQEKYWNKVYKKMSMKEFEKIIEEFKNECNSER